MSTTQRKRRGRAAMYDHVSSYLSGSETQSSYCQRHDLSKSTLGYWLRKYRESASGTPDRVPEPESAHFVSLSPESSSETGDARPSVGLSYAGVEVILSGEISSAYVAGIIHNLSRVC